MQLNKLAFFFSFLTISVVVSASKSIPLEFLFESSDSKVQVRHICFNSIEWFREYFSRVKDSGLDLNITLKDGNTLLHVAVQECCPNMVKALLEAEADVFKKNSFEETPFDIIRSLLENEHYKDVWDIFAEAGYELDEEESEGSEGSQVSQGSIEIDGFDKNSMDLDVKSEAEQASDDEDQLNPSKKARIDKSDDFQDLKTLINSPKNGEPSQISADFDVCEAVNLLNEDSDGPLPIPPRFIPVLPHQVFVDPKNVIVGEKFMRI